MKPLLVSQRLVGNAGYAEIREALDVEWGAFLTACGYLPIPVAARVPAADYAKLKPAGVLLTGGNDLSAYAPEDPLNLERDRVETGLIEAALQNHLPLIGVCRGMQMLTHYFGGRLEKKAGHVGNRHTVLVVPETRSAAFLGKSELDVNSYHNYCVTSLGRELRAFAVHADGSMEGVEHLTRPFYGMMWHPERNRPFSESDIRFFRKVFG